MKNKNAQTTLPKDKVVKLYRTALQAGIPFETVHQKVAHLEARENGAEEAEKVEQELQRKNVSLKKRLFLTLTPCICVLFGIALVGAAVWPLFSYYIFTPDDLYKVSLLSPIPHNRVLDIM